MPNYKVKTDRLNIRCAPNILMPPIGIVESEQVLSSPDTTGWVPIILEDESVGWVSAQYVDLFEIPPGPTPPISKDPPWIVWANKQLGVKEVPGAGDNPVIQAWYHLTTLPESMWHDSTAWCAVFVNAGFFLNGVKGLRSARAVDWLEFGKDADNDPQLGDVVIFDWGGGAHHVAYVLSVSSSRVNVIGGNQSDAVTKTSYPLNAVMGFRRAIV